MPSSDPGALISMTMKGTVGVMPDEIPQGEWGEAALLQAMFGHGDEDFWAERAHCKSHEINWLTFPYSVVAEIL